jgi:serine/threonine protein kinase
VIKLYDTYSDRDSFFFLTEYVQGGDLMAYMIDQGSIPDTVACFLSAGLCLAIEHIHSKGFVHRDIKPENCLITKTGYLKVADLGLAKRLPALVEVGRGRTEISLLAFTMCGTPEFMAPEFCMSVGYDQGADWWAFGCVLFEMYMGRNPFDTGGDLKGTFKEVCLIGMGKAKLQLHPKFVQKYPQAADMLNRCLTYASGRMGKKSSSEKNRVKKDEPQNHAYFGAISFKDLENQTALAPYIPTLQSDKDLFHFQQNLQDLVREPIPIYEGTNEWCQDF